MTDKELRRLKRSELLEILFYMRTELDALKTENAALKARVDALISAPNASNIALTEESRQALVESLRAVIKDCLNGKAPPGKGKRANRRKGDAKHGTT